LEEKISLALDLNVLLDVAQQREPFYRYSEAVLTMALTGRVRAFLPPHVLTTFYYLVRKSHGLEIAGNNLDSLLRLEIAPSGSAELRRARSLPMADFEDAVVASAAEAASCSWVVTRDLSDFSDSPVPPITPEEFLAAAAEEPPLTRSPE
jgi:predicted nucleic acid-binding protein